jgi:ribosomal protein S18 acetylase RimI-like enzyme
MRVRPLQRAELAVAAATFVLAFDGDPLFRDFLPRPEERAKWLRWLFVRALRESLAVGGAFTLDDGPEAASICLYPPGAWPPSLLGVLRAAPLPPAIPSWRFMRHGLALEHRIHTLHPAEPHVYVFVLGVHPSRQGRGLGGALLRHAEELARAANVPSHLETANPVNLSLYRRFGYEVQTELTSHGGPPVWTMTRAVGRDGSPTAT